MLSLFKMPAFIYWKIRDIKRAILNGKRFKPFGLYMFCGRQGSGKTVGMVYQLEQWRKKYPKCKIYTNFFYKHQDGEFNHWRQLVDGSFKNGEDGVIIAWDEIQNDFSSASYKDFPETVLSEVTQQRKQKMCILSTSQVFSRVVKPLREQCFIVVDCKTFLGRWTSLKAFDAGDYNTIVDNPTNEKKFKLPKLWKTSFIQTDDLRELYDSYAKIERMANREYLPRNER